MTPALMQFPSEKNQGGPQRIAPPAALVTVPRRQRQNSASRRMIGSGMPISHSNKPLPNVMDRSSVVPKSDL